MDREAARRIFDQFDVNGNGYVSAAELRQVVAELTGTELTLEYAQSLIDAADTDRNGVMSFEEFWAARRQAGLS